MNRFEIFLSELDGVNQFLSPQDFVLEVRISLKYKYIYVASSKCACTTIKAMLIRMELENRDHKFHRRKDIHEQTFSPLLNPMQVGNFRDLLRDRSFFKFCFVRNPYDRLLSAYLNKIAKNTWHRRELYARMGLEENESRAISFETFAQAVARQSAEDMNRHWRTQYYQTMQETFQYDLIGRVETLEEDCAKIGTAIGCNALEYYDGVPLNQSATSNRQSQNYTQNIKDIVYDTYRIDFEHFGYER